MKVNWIALVFWIGIAADGALGVSYLIWRHHQPVEVVATPPAQTVTVQSPVVVPPTPSPKPRYRPVTKPPVAKKQRKPVPPNYVVNCKMVPAMARTLPWAQVEAAARARGLTSSQIAQLKGCL